MYSWRELLGKAIYVLQVLRIHLQGDSAGASDEKEKNSTVAAE